MAHAVGEQRTVPLGLSNINSPTHKKSEQAKQHLATLECGMQSDKVPVDKSSLEGPTGDKARAPGIEHLCNIYGFDLGDEILPGGSSEEQNVPPEQLALPLPTQKISTHVPMRPPRPRANSSTPSLADKERLSSRSSPSKHVPSRSSSITPASKIKMRGHSERDVGMETRDQGESCVDMDIWGGERVDSGLRGYRYYDVFGHFLCYLYRLYRLKRFF